MSDLPTKNAYRAYVLFTALKLHFYRDGYDYFKYNKKTKWATPKRFLKTKGRWYYEHLAKDLNEHELEGFFVSQLVKRECWIGEITDSEAFSVYNSWKYTIENLFMIFHDDCSTMFQWLDAINRRFSHLFTWQPEGYPNLFCFYFQKDITLETLCIMLQLTGIDRYQKKEKNDLYFAGVMNKIRKYLPFLKIDFHKYGRILTQQINKHELTKP